MKVDIFDKGGNLIYTCQFGMYGGINYTMSETELFDHAFKMAIEEVPLQSLPAGGDQVKPGRFRRLR